MLMMKMTCSLGRIDDHCASSSGKRVKPNSIWMRKNLAKANCENSNENSLPKKKSSLFFMPWQLYKYPWLSLTHSNRHFRISSEWSFFLRLYSSLTKCDSGDLILSRHLIRVMSRQKESSLLWCQRSFALLRCFVSFSVCIDFLFLTVKTSHINAGSW